MTALFLRTSLRHLRRPQPARPASVGVPAEQGRTVVDALRANGRRLSSRPAMWHARFSHSASEWEMITWSDYLLAVRQVAAGLAELGLQPGGRTAILSANRVEWHLADLGTLYSGGASVPVYPTSSPAQISYLLNHAKVEVCFLDSHTQLGKVLSVRDELEMLRRIVIFEPSWRAADSLVSGLDDLRAIGADAIGRDPDAVDRRAGAIGPDDLATIVYTSGTTGPPKGAMVTHGNVMWTLRHVTPEYGIGEGDRLLSFLPLSHIAERMMSDFGPISYGGETWFARSLATVAEDLPASRPTVFLAVPRVWEKLREGVEDRLRSQPAPVRRAVERYISLGLEKVGAEQAGRDVPLGTLGVYGALDRSLGATLRRQLGLDRARVLVSAAAPIHADLVSWFHAIGLPLVQIYGQTEDCGPTTANRLGKVRIGTVGPPVPGVTVRIAEDGEILVKGGNVCAGYLDDPAATADLLDADGWMHSGDTGAFEPDGSLRIIGRKKDLIITASGKNVAPQEIESDLSNHPLVSEAIVVGEGRKFLTAILTLDTDEATRWAQERSKLSDIEALASDPDLLAEIGRIVEEVNAKRSHAEGIRKFHVLARDLTFESGELTPTLKVKRAVVYEHLADVIEDLYAGS